MTKKTHLVIMGSVAFDKIMVFDGLFQDLIKPDKLHVLSISLLIENQTISHGGVAANICYSLALLGEKPRLLGAVGRDAREYIDRLSLLGIDVSQVQVTNVATAHFTGITDKNNCQIGAFYPGAMGQIKKPKNGWFAKESLVVIAPHDPAAMKSQVDYCQQNKIAYFYDVGQQASNLSGADLLSGVRGSVGLIVNDYELSVITDKIKLSEQEILERTGFMIVTLGEKGAKILQKNKRPIQIGSVKVDEVVDPTGAGDAFRAGFLYGFVRGWQLTKCVKLGSVVASFAIEKRGTQNHALPDDQINTRYEETYHERLQS